MRNLNVVLSERGDAGGDVGDAVLTGELLCGFDPRVHEGDDLDSWGGGEDFEVGAADRAAAHERDPRGVACVVC